MTKNVKKNTQATGNSVNRDDFEATCVILMDAGFKVIDVVGSEGNDGYVFAYNTDYIEIWDNTAKRVPNIAIRPLKRFEGSLPVKGWNQRKDISVTSPKRHKTFRVACKTDTAVATVLLRCIKELRNVEKKAVKKAQDSQKGVA